MIGSLNGDSLLSANGHLSTCQGNFSESNAVSPEFARDPSRIDASIKHSALMLVVLMDLWAKVAILVFLGKMPLC